MGYYTKRVGFFRKQLLIFISNMQKVAFRSKFFGLFKSLVKVHFFVYTGMSLRKALINRKSVAISACRRVKRIYTNEFGKIHPEINKECAADVVSMAYIVFIRKIIK